MPTVVVAAAIIDARGRICCVQQTYGGAHWALPGGGMEPEESPIQTLVREVREETGFEVHVDQLIGVYSAPWQDRLSLCFAATIEHRMPWNPTSEIAAVRFFSRDDLPAPMTSRMRRRIADAFAGKFGIVQVFTPE